MAVEDQEIGERHAIYNGDSIEVMADIPDNSIALSAYSPPFAGDAGGLFNYSSSPHDLSNCRTMEEFFEHYEFLVREIKRITMPGRMTAVHCMDTPGKSDDLLDFPGEVIRLHKRLGFKYHARFAIWKEPLRVAIRTRSKGLTHRQLCKDSTFSNNAGADYLLIFKNAGENKIPVVHPSGLTRYVGEREIPETFTDDKGTVRSAAAYLDWDNPQTNKRAHWIWQQYASSFWDDIRINRVLPYKAARDKDDEKHCHPLQLDVIERCVIMWSNSDETVLTPFMGVGSEICGALFNGRKGVGIELKPSYFRQSKRNIASVLRNGWSEADNELSLLESGEDQEELEPQEAATSDGW